MSKRIKKDGKSGRAETPLANFRVLVKQALSVEISKAVEDLDIQGVRCQIAIRPAHDDLPTQRKLGGATLAVEFRRAADHDLVAAARDGFELIEDFLSAITVVSGTTFAPSEIVQVAKLGDGNRDCDFVQFLPLSVRHWHEEISDDKLTAARKLLAHWDGLDNGHRLRRAAKRYRFAAGVMDDVSAFLEAHTGLEAMEKPLAIAAGLTPGAEEMQASCPKCGHQYSYKRTALVGVRALVHRTIDPAKADKDHVADWKRMNSLRNEVTHSLADDSELKDRPLDALVATMHYLHDAICTYSHCPELSSAKYTLTRGPVEFVIVGR
jgi:hypothetical protein